MPRKRLRNHYRRLRRDIADEPRRKATERIIASLNALELTGWIGAYVAVDGEVDLGEFLEDEPQICLPRITDETMQFHTAGEDLVANRWNILEPPAHAPIVEAAAISTLLTPLVAYDDHGTRLGFGGGYYDRYLTSVGHAARPRVLGIAFACQHSSDPLPRAAWDVPLDGVVTENGVLEFATS